LEEDPVTIAGRAAAGLFVDLDGTLADSLGVLYETYADFLRHFGTEATRAEFETMNGPPLRIVVQQLKAAHALPGTEESLYALYMNMLASKYDVVPAHEGAAELLKYAHDTRWRIAIVTSGLEALAGRWLSRVGLHAMVWAVVGFERAGRGKPHPDPYLNALNILGCAARDSVAIEDSRQGVIAATRAGLRTVVVRREQATAEWPQVAATVSNLAQAREVLAAL
jgi:beta-phosphoglucomutase-like phosphatase (HAD superfamily)